MTLIEEHTIAWNTIKAHFPQNQCVHQLFEAQVEQMPDAIAVVFEDEYLTYQELNDRANQVAHFLRDLGVGPEVLVGICVERSLELVVGLLGILKAGGAYLPLDPTYPEERLTYMLQDARVSLLLTQQRLLTRLPAHQAHVICLDSDQEAIWQKNKENLVNLTLLENLAYVIYTSGSTGHPKGVSITHNSLLNLVFWHQLAFDVTACDRATQLTSPAFDATGWELWPYLAKGASVYLPDEETRIEAPALRDWLLSRGITITFLPTALAESVMALDWPSSTPLRFLLTGADTLHHYPSPSLPFALINNYGPTETTVVATSGYIPPGENSEALPSIGRPIADTQVYLLDQHMAPVPDGTTGELYIGGIGVARGYLDRPGLTAEKFPPHPFSKVPGERLYKTGDLARYLPSGEIEFLGRVDHQVKLRGFRIELGEIEAALRRHLSVRESVVLAREDIPGDKYLVAYLVPRQQPVPSILDLRSYLQNHLPAYMIPSAFVWMETLPLSPNGKVDRHKLPVPDCTRPELEARFVAAHTPIEQMLAVIWSEVMHIAQVGMHDNFFDLGGHSLQAMQIVARVREALQVELPVRSFFQTPTIAGLAESIEAMCQAVEYSLSVPPLCHLDRQGSLPLSFAQERLWFLNQLAPDSPFYNVPIAVHMRGLLDVRALEQSLNEIAMRHETLRTTFESVKGQPIQVIAANSCIVLSRIDVSSLPEVEKEARIQRLVNEEVQRPFDLARDQLLRVTLLQLEKEEYVLLLTMHHIISDGWSIGVFFHELEVLYESYSTGKPSPLPALPIQYADFAYWQRQWLQGKVVETQLSYWKRQLENIPPLLQLPIDRPRPAVQTYRGATQSLPLSRSLTDALQALSRQEGVTLFMTLLSAFKALLMYYTGQNDIVVGTPTANRNQLETEKLIGFFVNTLVLRTDISGDPTFHELMSRVRDTALEGYAHQDIPFEWIVEEIRPERDLSRNPLFQVMFALQDTPSPIPNLVGVSTEPLTIETNATLFDISMDVTETAEGLVASLEYSTDLFDAATMARMLQHYSILLNGIVSDPNQRLSELPLLSSVEQQQLLVEWSNTNSTYPSDRCVHSLFEDQSATTPEAVAVIYEDQSLSYRELNQRANQLARYLRQRGIGPEVRVGICMERSLEMVVGLLGILKAGGAYVPLDPAYPKERLAFMLEDTHMQIMLTQERFVTELPPTQAQVICLDSTWSTIAQESTDNVTGHVAPENIAYTIYTSGSTGRPKGVLIPHRALVNHNLAVAKTYELQPSDRVLQFASISFDVAAEEIFPTLLSGATIVLRPGQAVDSLLHFLKWVKKERLTVLNLPTPYWQEWVSELPTLEVPLPSSVRLVIVGSEQALPEHAATWQKWAANRAQWYNAYGLTEATITSTIYTSGKDYPALRSVPIGRPILNTQIYLLDHNLRLVPVGVPGELYVGGAGLARGYLDQPERTAEKFIPNPFGDEPGARLYKSGDRARYLPDGNLEFLGRTDHQVKFRGYRIELGEIETVSHGHAHVRETVVQLREDDAGNKYLAAYVVPSSPESTPLVSDLRTYLSEKLPGYMVPSAFVVLAALPLTPNGKIDYEALPAPERTLIGLNVGFAAPCTPVEEVLADIWAEVLKLERIGIHDNFFEVGGHSLLATQVISRIRDALQVDIPVHTLFQAPTVASLAQMLVQYETTPGQVTSIARLRKQIDELSADEIRAILQNKKEAKGGING